MYAIGEPNVQESSQDRKMPTGDNRGARIGASVSHPMATFLCSILHHYSMYPDHRECSYTLAFGHHTDDVAYDSHPTRIHVPKSWNHSRRITSFRKRR